MDSKFSSMENMDINTRHTKKYYQKFCLSDSKSILNMLLKATGALERSLASGVISCFLFLDGFGVFIRKTEKNNVKTGNVVEERSGANDLPMVCSVESILQKDFITASTSIIKLTGSRINSESYERAMLVGRGNI